MSTQAQAKETNMHDKLEVRVSQDSLFYQLRWQVLPPEMKKGLGDTPSAARKNWRKLRNGLAVPVLSFLYERYKEKFFELVEKEVKKKIKGS